MRYNRCGRSGLKLPAISLGLWHNFGGVDVFENARAMIHRAFDLGITHFDLANNYGPPYGSAEETFGRIFSKDLAGYRDELVISSKAGWDMWPGPYGDWGSRKACSRKNIWTAFRPIPARPSRKLISAAKMSPQTNWGKSAS
jgi:L-glyceraldehyde 3-phosphate reductase